MNNARYTNSYMALGALAGGLLLTTGAAWLPFLIKWFEEWTSASSAIYIGYGVYFVIAGIISLIFVQELIKSHRTKKRCTEMMEGSFGMDLHDKQLFYSMAKKQIGLAKRNKWPVSMIAIYIQSPSKSIDIADFGKKIKELVTKELVKLLRNSDLAGSFAKNEYLVLLPNCDEKHIEDVMRRLEKNLGSRRIMMDEKNFQIKCKCSTTTMNYDVANLERLMERAYGALDQAEQENNNMIKKH